MWPSFHGKSIIPPKQNNKQWTHGKPFHNTKIIWDRWWIAPSFPILHKPLPLDVVPFHGKPTNPLQSQPMANPFHNNTSKILRQVIPYFSFMWPHAKGTSSSSIMRPWETVEAGNGLPFQSHKWWTFPLVLGMVKLTETHYKWNSSCTALEMLVISATIACILSDVHSWHLSIPELGKTVNKTLSAPILYHTHIKPMVHHSQKTQCTRDCLALVQHLWCQLRCFVLSSSVAKSITCVGLSSLASKPPLLSALATNMCDNQPCSVHQPLGV